VHDLERETLVETVEPRARQGSQLLLAAGCLDRSLDHLFGDPVRLHDHHRPTPLVPLTSDKRHRVVGPPQTFQRRNYVVTVEFLLAGEFERVGHRVQRLDGFRVTPRSAGISHPINHQKAELRDRHENEVPGGRPE
jgi:hypothetical protein